MSLTNFIIRLPITPTEKFQMREFSSIVSLDQKDLICASRDGRIFQFDRKTYELKRTLFLHSSWISAMYINDKYFVTGSYDSTICLSTSEEIYNYSIQPKFIKFDEHHDYILSIAILDNLLISSSSEPVILLSTITKDSIISYRKLNLNISVHSILPLTSNEIVLGTIEGKILTYNVNQASDQKQIYFYDSPIKFLSKNQEYLAVGYLDGSVLIFTLSEQHGSSNQNDSIPTIHYQLFEKYKFDSSIVSICPYHNKFVSFTRNGNIYDLNKTPVTHIEIAKQITYGYLTLEMNEKDKSKMIPFYHIATYEKTMICMTNNNEIINKVEGNKTYIKAQRIPHTTSSILCKTDNKEVELWNLDTLTMENNFGIVKFRTKMKELSKSPAISFPVSFDISTGQVILVIPQILPRLMKKEMETQKKALTNIIKNIIQSKIKFIAVDNKGKMVWNNFSRFSVPYWLRYLLDPKFQS